MPPNCRICTHLERVAIDKAIVAGSTERAIASQYGLGRTSVQRHKVHIGRAIKRAEVETGRTLASILELSHADLDEAKEMARASAESGTLVRVVQARAKLAEVEFGTKGKLDVTVVDVPDEELIPKAIEFLELRGYKVNKR